jgi:hypothetical protein
MAADDLIMQRLEDRIQWYDSHSIKDQKKFKVLKTIVIVAAALIPFLSGLNLKERMVWNRHYTLDSRRPRHSHRRHRRAAAALPVSGELDRLPVHVRSSKA